MRKVLLYSGGMDSWLIRKLWKPDVCLYVDMKTRYSEQELARIRRADTNVVITSLPLGIFEREDGIIPLRNLFLVALATNFGDEVCLGATAGDRVLDKNPTFAALSSGLLSYLYQAQHWTAERQIKINVDFKEYTKTQLVRRFVAAGGDLDELVHGSFSCYFPQNEEECWQCKPCFRKFVALVNNGYVFPQLVSRRSVVYIEQKILPLIQAGTYGRAEEEAEILRCLELVKC